MTLMQSLCAFSYPRACYRLLSLIRTHDLRSKVLSLGIAKLMPALFCYYHTLYYLCMRHQGCMADIGLAENIPSNDLNRVVPA